LSVPRLSCRRKLRGDCTVLITHRPLLAALLLTAGLTQARPGDAVDAKFRGDWVPAKAACTSPLKVSIAARAVTFVNGTQRAEFTKLDQCVSCMGRDVQDVTLLSTDQMGDSPWMLTLDASRKGQAIVSADFSNDKKLGARFPLGTAALKMRSMRC